MFSSNVRHFAKGAAANTLLDQIAEALAGKKFPVERSDGKLVIVGAEEVRGAKPKLTVSALPSQDGVVVDVAVTNELDQNTLVLFIVFVVIFWPIALYFGYTAWQAWDRVAKDLVRTVETVVLPHVAKG